MLCFGQLTKPKACGLVYRTDRGVAQPGSALHWGCSGRRFKSCRPDHFSNHLNACNFLDFGSYEFFLSSLMTVYDTWI